MRRALQRVVTTRKALIGSVITTTTVAYPPTSDCSAANSSDGEKNINSMWVVGAGFAAASTVSYLAYRAMFDDQPMPAGNRERADGHATAFLKGLMDEMVAQTRKATQSGFEKWGLEEMCEDGNAALLRNTIATATAERTAPLLEELFRCYDINSDGELTRGEFEALVSKYVRTSFEHQASMVEAMTKTVLYCVFKVQSKDSWSPVLTEALLREKADEQWEVDKVDHLTNGEHLKQGHPFVKDPEAHCRRVWDAMDTNTEGRVTKAAFITSFLTVVTSLDTAA